MQHKAPTCRPRRTKLNFAPNRIPSWSLRTRKVSLQQQMRTLATHKTFSDGTDFSVGHQYCFHIGSEKEWPGIILSEPDVTRWRFTTNPKRNPWSPLNLFSNPQFVVTDRNEQEALRVRRNTRFPPRFEMIEDGKPVGIIKLRSLLRNRYTIQFGNEPIWTFHMPLFTIHFRAESASGKEVLVRVGPSKRQWNLLTQPGTDSVYFLCALAFIHREWWCFS